MTGKTRARSAPDGTADSHRSYPRFTGGQVLTHQDLNLLRDFLDGQDRILGQAIGFGINAGLTATAGAPDDDGRQQFTVDPGLGIDQPGRVLWLDKSAKWPDLAKAVEDARKAPPAKTPFGFIEATPGGATAVLVLDDEDQEVPRCGETDCAGHSALRLRTAKVLLVPGRLKPTAPDFSTEPLLREAPLTIGNNGSVQGDFNQLRNAISSRLDAAGVKLSDTAAKFLSGLTLTLSTPLAVGQYRAAFLNHVFFATLDLLRVRALLTPSPRDTDRPGIALGWIVLEGKVHTWNPAYRHDFEPPVGLANALTVAGSLDAVAQMRNRLEALFLDYNEPTIPPPSDSGKPPDEGDLHICYKGKCRVIRYPPIKISDKWRDFYREEVHLIKGPGHGLVDPVAIDVLYGTDPPDFAQAGVISLGPALGRGADATAEFLKKFIEDQGIDPDVEVHDAVAARALRGFSVQGTVSLGDKLVLVKDEQGKVLEVGRVSNQQALKNAGGVLTAAKQEAQNAATGARQAAQAVGLVHNRVKEVEDSLSQLKAGDLTEYQHLATLAERLSTAVIGEQLEQLRTDLTHNIESARDETKQLQQSVISGAEKVSGLMSEHTSLQQDVKRSLDLVDRNSSRIDGLFSPGRRSCWLFRPWRQRYVPPSGFMPGLGEFLDALTSALLISAPPDSQETVRAELAAARGAFHALSGGAALEASQREDLAMLAEALVAAAAAAGLPAGELSQVRSAARTLTGRLRGTGT